MPYPNEHAARVKDPSAFVRFRRTTRKHEGKTYSVIRGQKKDGSWETQSYRYPTKDWTAKAARTHAQAHGARGFEMANKKKKTFSAAVVDAGDMPVACPAGSLLFSGEDDDFPVQEFIKDVIREGTWSHPKKEWELPVNGDRMDRWVRNFNMMQENGVEVPVVEDHNLAAASTLGYVKSLFRVGKELKCRLEARGRQAIDTVQRVKYVSLGLRSDFKDGQGNEYDEVIEHIGMTPVPVVSGQKDIVRIAASRGHSSQSIPVFRRLATEDGSMDMKELAKVLGLDADTELTEENALEHIQNKVAEGTVAADKLKEADAKIVSLSEQIEKIKASKDDAPTLTENEAEDAAEAVADEVEKVTASLGLKPADAKELTRLLTGSPEDRNLHLLSRVAAPNDEGRRPIRAKAFTDWLKKIKPENMVTPGSKTGVQTYSRGGDENDGQEKPEAIKERASKAYG